MLHEIIEGYRGEIIAQTQKLIQIKSVKAQSKPGMPFGQGIHDALEAFLNLADSLGFKTKSYEGYAGIVTMGSGQQTLGILSHLDVVPEGTGWTHAPFGGELIGDRIYGRGSLDDKGPSVAALFAMKAIKESGLKLRKKVEMMVGTDEESGHEGIHYLFKHHKKPDIGLSPDGDYPVIFAEKGILHIDCFQKWDNDSQIIVCGGLRPNMVPEACECKMAEEPLRALMDVLNSKGYAYQRHEGGGLTVEGHSAHGSMPEKGVNACQRMLDALSAALPDESAQARFIRCLQEAFLLETDGTALGLNLSDAVSGHLSLNVGMLNIDAHQGRVVLDIRYPVSLEKDEIIRRIDSYFKLHGIQCEERMHHAPLYVPKDSQLIQTLLDVYYRNTGRQDQPIAIGGGTYARVLKNAVAFGAAFPEREAVMHQKDEYILVEDLIMNAKIYADAIAALS